MPIYDPLRDREAKAEAARFSGANLIGTIEPLEDVRQVFVADTDSVVANLDSGASCPVRKPYFNLAAGGRVLYGVFDDNQEKTLDRGRISGNPYRTICKFPCDLDCLARRQNAGLLCNLLQMQNEIDVGEVKFGGPGIRTGQCQ